MKALSGFLFLLMVSLPYVIMTWLGLRTPAVNEAPSETLTIISPHRREVRQEYSRGFGEWMRAHHKRAVAIQWLDVGGTSKILKEIESRYAANPDAPGVDLLFGGGVAPYYTCMEHGWLMPVKLSDGLLAAIPERCAGSPVYDSSNRWFGVALSGFGIIYNRALIERLGLPTPVTWDDLGRPEFFSWLASGDPRSSGSVHMCYEIILQVYGLEAGWDLITRLCANVRSFSEAGGAAPRDVAAGEVAAGMVIDQYAQTVIDSVGRDALAFKLPENATIVGADSVGLLKGAPSPETARLFIEYALSEEGQRLLFQPAGVNGQRHSLYRLPVRKALYDGPDAPATRPYEYQGAFRYDEQLAGRRWGVVNDMIGVWLIDSHPDLARAWQAAIRSGLEPDCVRRLCALPIPAERFAEFEGFWGEPRKRSEALHRWAAEARTRYRELQK